MKTFVIMGRAGDIIICLPAFRWLHERGEKFGVVCSPEFSPIFDGVSYAEVVNQSHSYPEALRWCEAMRIKPTVLRWWMLGEKADGIPKGEHELKFNGSKWKLNFSEWPNYQTSLWMRTGVPTELMKTLPLEFDRRNYQRENELVAAVEKKNRKKLPLLLYNMEGFSSPFAATPEVVGIINRWSKNFHLVDLSKIRCERIYDLLGLYDAAELLVTIDTATLHLAAGSNVRTIAYTNVGWASSVPRGNVVCEIKYPSAASQCDRLNNWISSTLNTI